MSAASSVTETSHTGHHVNRRGRFCLGGTRSRFRHSFFEQTERHDLSGSKRELLVPSLHLRHEIRVNKLRHIPPDGPYFRTHGSPNL